MIALIDMDAFFAVLALIALLVGWQIRRLKQKWRARKEAV